MKADTKLAREEAFSLRLSASGLPDIAEIRNKLDDAADHIEALADELERHRKTIVSVCYAVTDATSQLIVDDEQTEVINDLNKQMRIVRDELDLAPLMGLRRGE